MTFGNFKEVQLKFKSSEGEKVKLITLKAQPQKALTKQTSIIQKNISKVTYTEHKHIEKVNSLTFSTKLSEINFVSVI